MAESVRVQAAAKVNLHLRVYKRRIDGFHDILSLFQAVSLTDSIVIRSLKEFDIIEIEGDFDCPAQSTTVYQAVLAYRKAFGIDKGLSISVEKHIPAGSGLGGGSSDAAAVLTGLDALWGGNSSLSTLSELGASIGSDVPFFIESTAALVSGRGEAVQGIQARTDFSLVLVFPGFPIATAGAYALLDRERPDDSNEPDPSPESLITAYYGDIGLWPYSNSFEAYIGAQQGSIPRVKELLLGAGASFAAMSGSGSTIFGIFEDDSRASTAAGTLAEAGFEAHVASPLARGITLG
jgi:4-diphosphocytidyl-2-C-methyl-D-erythritol kinase